MLRECEDAAAARAGKSYSLCELALLRLVLDGPQVVRDGDAIAAEHLRASPVYFGDFIARQAKWLSVASNAENAQVMGDGMSPETVEFACCVCFRSLANVVLIGTGDKQYCGDCAPGGCAAWFRFMSVAGLRAVTLQ